MVAGPLVETESRMVGLVLKSLPYWDFRPWDDCSERRKVWVHTAHRRLAVHQTRDRHTPVALARYFDNVVDALAREGIDVAQVVLELTPTRPMRGQVVTGRGPVLHWREDLGWSNGIKTTSPAAHPGEVAALLEQPPPGRG